MNSRLIPAVFALISGIAVSSCGTKKHQQAVPGENKVHVTKLSPVAQTEMLAYSGSIEPDNIVQVGFAVQGVVNDIQVKEGQRVTQGQLLASIDASEYVNALTIANASLGQAQDMYDRLKSLYEKGSLPEKDYIDIKTKLAQAKANKNINAKHISDSKLYAPMSGIISSRMIERGSPAAPGVAAFTIIKTDQVYARIAVPESEIGTLKHNMDVSVFIPTLEQSFKGIIDIINPQADAISKTYSVKIHLANKEGNILPGMLAEARINTGQSIKTITIPAQAIVRDADDITYVFVATDGKKAIRKRVTVGKATGNSEVTITEGLSTGVLIITSGQTSLRDGAAISF